MLVSKSRVSGSMLIFLSLYLLTACSLSRKRFSDWTIRLPEDRDYLYAVGGPSTERIEASDQA